MFIGLCRAAAERFGGAPLGRRRRTRAASGRRCGGRAAPAPQRRGRTRRGPRGPVAENPKLFASQLEATGCFQKGGRFGGKAGGTVVVFELCRLVSQRPWLCLPPSPSLPTQPPPPAFPLASNSLTGGVSIYKKACEPRLQLVVTLQHGASIAYGCLERG